MGSDHRSSKGQPKKKGVDRREFLKGATAAAGVAMLGPNIAACVDDDLHLNEWQDKHYGESINGTLNPMRRDGSSPLDYIDNVVILQMENRSFDHYFYSYGVDDGKDVVVMPSDTSNRMQDGTPLPIEWLDGEYLIDPDPPHMWGQVHDQWNGGANDGFVTEFEKVMGVKGSGGLHDHLDSRFKRQIRDEFGLRPKDGEEYDEKYAELYTDEIFEEEFAKRIGWVMGYYKREQLPVLYTLADNFTLCDQWFCSVLGPTWPNRNYSLAATSLGVKSNGTELRARTPYYSMVRDHGYSVNLYAYNTSFYFGLTVADFRKSRNDPKYPGLGLRAKKLSAFYKDCEQGTLPNVSIVEPDYALNDDHPPQDVRLGESFISSVYEALRKSPQWERTLLVIYYDEHGGFYDHVAPPKVEHDAYASEGFDQLGFRVPGLLVGPLVKPGHIMKNMVDHASVPKLISEIFGVEQVNDRAANAGSFEDAFDIERIDERRREDPPSMKNIEIPHAKIRHALSKPYGQPELYEFCRKIHGKDLPSMDQQLQDAEDYFRQLDRMRVARVVG